MHALKTGKAPIVSKFTQFTILGTHPVPARDFFGFFSKRPCTEPSAGVADSRLPAGWSATVSAREVLWNG